MPRQPAVGPRRTETRRRLVQAAIQVVARQGFHAASVDDIARQAGLSIGALYGNFAGKDDLLFAAFDEHVTWFEQRLHAAAERADPGAALNDWIGSLARDPEQFLIFIEFWAYAVRKPQARDDFARRMSEMRQAVAAAVDHRRQLAGTINAQPSPDSIALLLLALGRGLALEKLADPSTTPEKPAAELLANLLR